jgi:hypothetical protein
VQWTETIVVDRPLEQVQAAIADENQLMAWSAWPEATGYVCSVDGDGRTLGSSIVFRDPDGVELGRQRLTLVQPDRVEYRLRNRGPLGRDMTPEVDFRLSLSTLRAPAFTWTSGQPLRSHPARGTWRSCCSVVGYAGCT